jgi:predicted transglutaminase-like cysteine proteinase
MKKIVFCLLATCLSLTFLPLQSNAATTAEPSSMTATTPAGSAEAKTLELRLNEIKAMDKSKLTPSDKKNLRKEVKSINHKLRAISGGIYLSVGAVILIVILLIVLL